MRLDACSSVYMPVCMYFALFVYLLHIFIYNSIVIEAIFMEFVGYNLCHRVASQVPHYSIIFENISNVYKCEKLYTFYISHFFIFVDHITKRRIFFSTASMSGWTNMWRHCLRCSSFISNLIYPFSEVFIYFSSNQHSRNLSWIA